MIYKNILIDGLAFLFRGDKMREVVKIDDITYRIEDEYVRFFLLLGEDRAAVIDTGISGEGVRNIVEKITDKPLILINTHGDGDHTSATFEFDSYYINEKDYLGCMMNEKYPDSTPQFILDGDEIDLGKRVLRIIEIPGHTRGSVAILDVNNRCLFAGDSIQAGQIFMFGDHRNPELFENSIIKLLGMIDNYDVIYPSHDMPTLTNDYVEKVLDDWISYREGKLGYENCNVHGNMVRSYRGKVCCFFI